MDTTTPRMTAWECKNCGETGRDTGELTMAVDTFTCPKCLSTEIVFNDPGINEVRETIETAMDESVKKLGFQNIGELQALILQVNLMESAPELEQWRTQDGSKRGLLKVIRMHETQSDPTLIKEGFLAGSAVIKVSMLSQKQQKDITRWLDQHEEFSLRQYLGEAGVTFGNYSAWFARWKEGEVE